jgi:CRISPR type IV-associated protein Csf2
MKYKIDGTLRLTAPYHSAVPGKYYYNPDSRTFGREAGNEAFPVTRTNQMTFVPPGNDEGFLSDDDQGPTPTGGRSSAYRLPVIAANSVRGALRRVAAGIIHDILIKKGEVLSRDTYFAMQTGASGGQPDSSRPVNLDQELAAARHPFLGSFGGGPKIKQSKLEIAYGWPVLPMTQAGGLVPEDIEVTLKDNQRLTETVCFAHVDDLLRYSDPRAASIIRDYPKALTDWLAKIDESQKERKEKRTKRRNGTSVDPSTEAGTEPQKEAKKVDIRGLYFHEVVIPGVPFYTRFSLDARECGLAALGLLLASLLLFAERPIGGWVRNGYGRFKADLRLGEAGGPSQRLFVATTSGAYELDHNHPLVEPAMDAWAEYSENELNAASLEQVYVAK